MAKKTTKQKKQLEKDIKRVNERRAEIERAVNAGQLPREFLEQYEAAMRSAVHDNSLFTSKGNISHGKKAVEEINQRSIQALLKKETAGTAKRETYKYYQQYRQEQERVSQTADERADSDNPFDDTDYSERAYTYEDFVADRDYTYANIQNDPDWYVAMKAMFQGVSGRKSYKQLRTAHEAFTAASDKEKQRLYQEAVNREQRAYFG